MCGVEIVADRETRKPDPALAGRLNQAARERGLRSRPLGSALDSLQ